MAKIQSLGYSHLGDGELIDKINELILAVNTLTEIVKELQGRQK